MVAMRAVMEPGARHSPLNPCLAPTMHKPDEIFTVRAVSASLSALPTPALGVHTRVGRSNTGGRGIQDTPLISRGRRK